MLRKMLALGLIVLFGTLNLVSAFAPQNPFIQDGDNEVKKLPPVNWIRSRKIDVKHIAIDLRFDWDKEQAYGKSTLTVAPFSDTDRINLDAAYMTISSVKGAAGKDLKFNYSGKDTNDNLEIMLDRVYKRGEDVVVTVEYRTNYVNTADPDTAIGSFGRGLRFIKPNADQPNKPYQIWSQGETEFNRYWFPSYDTPNDFRTTELRATVDKKYTVVSNGSLVSKTSNPDGTVTFDWKMDTPYSNYLTSIVVAEYAEVKSGEYAGIPIYAYGYKNEAKEVYDTTKSVPDMVKFFSEMTGVKYAYPKYSQAMVEDFGGGMENISATTQIEEMIYDARTMIDQDSNSLQAHELAHQWFGDYVTCRDWGQIWLNESFATYFDGLYNEHSKGHEEFLYANVRSNQQAYYNDWRNGNRRPIVTKYYANKDAMFDGYAYPRGAAVLHMLRKHLGDENWWKAINHYLTSNAHTPVSTEEFRIAIEEATGQSMDWFFDQWLYRMGHPVFDVTKSYDPAAKKLTLNIKQTQKADPLNEYPQVRYFQTNVDVEIDGKVHRVWIDPKETNSFTFDSPTEPKLVNFDYEGTLIKEMKFEKSVDELVYQLLNDKDILGRRWAGEQLGAAYKSRSASQADKDKIMDAFRKSVETDSNWRIRRGTLSEIANIVSPDPSPGTERPAATIDAATTATIVKATKDKNNFVRGDALELLGETKDPKYADLFTAGIKEQSFVIVGQSATALAAVKAPNAYQEINALLGQKSWRGQSQIIAMNAFADLKDPRSLDTAFKYAEDVNQPKQVRSASLRIVGAVGKGDERSYPLIIGSFKKALANQDFQGIFNAVQGIIALADPRGQEAFDMLREKFNGNQQIMGFVTFMENQFKAALKK